MGKKKLKKQKIDINKSRREFFKNGSLMLAGAGLLNHLGLESMCNLTQSIFPVAHASEVPEVQRVLYIGLRAGFSLLGFGVDGSLRSLGSPLYPNAPYAGNQIQAAGNNLYLTPDSEVLRPHAANMAITQGVTPGGPHTGLFSFWEGGIGAGLRSPIIDVIMKNSSASMLPGLHFRARSSRTVTHQLNGGMDLTDVTNATITSSFQKPTLLMSSEHASKVLTAATKLSRRQALKSITASKHAHAIGTEYNRASEMVKVDYAKLLNLSSMDAEFSSGSGIYKQLGESLGYGLKTLGLNLANSVSTEIYMGDGHGRQDAEACRPIYQELAKKLNATINYLKATPDLATMGQKTLWETTLVVVGSEFTRGNRGFGVDNQDNQSQGILLFGSKVRGGYYGTMTLETGSSTNIVFSGVDVNTGSNLAAGQLNSPANVYHTINKLLNNPNVNESMVIKKMVA